MKINRWLQLIRDMPLFVKLIAIIVSLILLALIMGSVITYNSYSTSIARNASKYQEDLVRESTANIDYYMNEFSLLSIVPYQHEEVLSFIGSNRNPDQALTLDERILLENFASRMVVNSRVDVAGFSLYGLQGASYILPPHSFMSVSYDGWHSEEIIQKAANTGRSIYIGPHYVRSTTGINYEVFSVIRKLRSLDKGIDLGFIVLDVDFADLRAKVDELIRTEYESIGIADEEGRWVYHKGVIPVRSEDINQYQGTGTERILWDGEDQLLTYHTSPITGWTTFQAVPMSMLLMESKGVFSMLLVISVVLLLLAALIAAWLSYRITYPISTLKNLMKRVERGDLHVAAPVKGRDEIGELSRTFNIMVTRLSELGYLLYESEIREKNAQIAALQSQINPHFLYNTLGTISMYAEIRNNTEISHIANNLGKLLRYSIHGDKNEVTLAQELNHVQGYMAIQQVRYEERLTFHIQMDDDTLLDCHVIRLIVQPVVENAILHGFDKGEGIGSVELWVVKHYEQLLITIKDNGIGMTESRLNKVRKKLQDGSLSDSPTGHGLVNVHRRIVLRYGHEYGLSIDSKISIGTTVTICLPYIVQQN
jgi:two-component system, sensor histidine kinase YesM